MTKLKSTLCVLLAVLMLFSVLAVAPVSALEYELEKPQNFRVTDFTDSTVTLSWSPAANNRRPYYQIVWSTTTTPDWRGNWWIDESSMLNNKNTGDFEYKATGFSEHNTLYFFVRWVGLGSTKTEKYVEVGHAGDGLGFDSVVPLSDYTMIKFDWTMPETKSDTKTTTAKAPSVKVTAKAIKAAALKKSDKTIKPLTIKNAKKIKVVKVKKGTSKKIYKKIKVSKKTGAITFKKGKYKKATYKIRLKIKADSKTFNKTVKVKIK